METMTMSSTSSSQPQSLKQHRHRFHKQRENDPFLNLPNDDNPLTKLPSNRCPPPSSPEAETKSQNPPEPQSFLLEFLLTPLNMLSLLLSLYWVDYRQRSWRNSQRSNPSPNPGVWLLNPEPYRQAPSSSTSAGDGGGIEDDAKVFGGWYRRKKHRALARLEFGEALEVRGRVLVAMAVWGVLGLGGVGWVVCRGWELVWG
ncbi:hypothetical protein MBLNU230_g8137t1 [Neophaeotheca triangularis]